MAEDFRLTRDGAFAIITFDKRHSKVNTLSTSTLTALNALLESVEQTHDIRGCVIHSGKPHQCVAGADLREIAALGEGPIEPLAHFIDLGHAAFNRLASLRVPSVGLVEGPALGGGLELLLACDALLAVDSPRTRLGVPEVKLDLIPAWGGTQRLPRLIGLRPALEMLLCGEPLAVDAAHAKGLLDAVCGAESPLESALALLESRASNQEWELRRAERRQRLVMGDGELEHVRASGWQRLAPRHKGPSEVPETLFEVVLEGVTKPLAEGLFVERNAALGLFQKPAARNRILVFFMQSKAREAANAINALDSKSIRRVGIVGAGQMGSGIAAAASSGFNVTIFDPQTSQLSVARERVAAAQKRSKAAFECHLTDDFEALVGCELIIEAIPEAEESKLALLHSLNKFLTNETIVATNTSSLSVARLSTALASPENFAGFHFFHPVERMPLIELVRGPRSSPQTLATLRCVAKELGKLAIEVADGPGFLVNRLLFATLREAIALSEDGHPIDRIDAAAVEFGLPMGPFALLDFVGLDTALAIFEILSFAYPTRMSIPRSLRTLVDAGQLGHKSEGGYYRAGVPLGTQGLVRRFDDAKALNFERVLLAMLLEATHVLEEGIAPSAQAVDLALVLGIGFPAWRGGILRWADQRGIARVTEELDALVLTSPRWQPTHLLVEMARKGALFHPRSNS
jgi:3-hydroxyacyl-CoA dehydrogenase/enoyl-CoA hydratase/3-hydroxybutyryl-CoA epimerase/3-hydroxyacyl-CoA dehydrogenase/enoyl-CoA hydratase/3-hydroxybutyryl-CoA epimerase/enoyl-CoA isomerase